jgi:hypothetical protein
MNFYASSCKRNPDLTIRVHPLLLSLTETINASDGNPDLSNISENDERASKSNHYTSPAGAFPPLEIHFPGQNCMPLLSVQNGMPSSRLSSWLPGMHGARP